MSYPISTFTAFAKDLIGLERSIRFVEACFQLIALRSLLPGDPKSTHFLRVANQLNLVRRFFRLFDWVDCLLVMTSVKPGLNARHKGFWHILDLARWLALSGFFFLDMLVLPHELGFELQLYDSAEVIQIQALACWFHFITISIVLAVKELVSNKLNAGRKEGAIAKQSGTGKKGGPKGKASPSKKKRETTEVSSSSAVYVGGAENLDVGTSWAAYEELVTCGLDVVIPAHFCGYLVTDMVIVSVGMALSSLVTMMSRWNTISAEHAK